MTYYIKFDKETGKPVYANPLNGPIEDVLFYSPETHKAFEGDIPDLRKVYWDGELKVIPESPDPAYEFNYITKNWERNLTKEWQEVKERREFLFSKTEWVRSKCADLGQPVPQEWIDYWQALRDITLQPDPANIIWPEKPTT